MTKHVTMGIDVGYSHTKIVTAKGKDVFRSTVKKGRIDINTKSTVIEYDGKVLTIGERGRITVNPQKTEDENFLPLLLTAIVRNMDEKETSINVNLVTGLPIAWYPSQKDSVKNELEGKNFTVTFKDKRREININEVIVFPQSAGLALTNPDDFSPGKTNLIIDIGGLTVDVSHFEGRQLAHSDSYELGMIKFYSSLAAEINSKHNVSVDDQAIERFIENGYLTIKEERVDFDFASYFVSHMDTIITRIKTDFPYDIVDKKTFVGGGSLRFKDHLPKNNGIECDEIQSNAEAFYRVGTQKFE